MENLSPDLTAPALRRRMGAWLYECLVAGAISLLVSIVFTLLSAQLHADTTAQRRVVAASIFAVLGLYFAWSWMHGQTLAMKTWRMRIVDASGRRLAPGRALLRYVLCGAWFVPPLALSSALGLGAGEACVVVAGWVAVWAILSRFHPQRQFWHDAVAGTRLINAGS